MGLGSRFKVYRAMLSTQPFTPNLNLKGLIRVELGLGPFPLWGPRFLLGLAALRVQGLESDGFGQFRCCLVSGSIVCVSFAGWTKSCTTQDPQSTVVNYVIGYFTWCQFPPSTVGPARKLYQAYLFTCIAFSMLTLLCTFLQVACSCICSWSERRRQDPDGVGE